MMMRGCVCQLFCARVCDDLCDDPRASESGVCGVQHTLAKRSLSLFFFSSPLFVVFDGIALSFVTPPSSHHLLLHSIPLHSTLSLSLCLCVTCLASCSLRDERGKKKWRVA